MENNQIVRPIGKVVKKIEILADENGVIQVFPWNLDLLKNEWVPMNPREMVLGLLKICMDTTAVLFSGETIIQPAGSTDGQESATGSHNNSNLPGGTGGKGKFRKFRPN